MEQIKDIFLLSAGDTYTAGSTGDESDHALTENEIPSNEHDIKIKMYRNDFNDVYFGNDGFAINYSALYYQNIGNNKIAIGNHFGTAAKNVYLHTGTSHNNMPPYLVVYMWKRVS